MSDGVRDGVGVVVCERVGVMVCSRGVTPTNNSPEPGSMAQLKKL